MDRANRRWAETIARQHADVVRIGYIGSYARDDWGVGSDVGLIVVCGSETPDLHPHPRRRRLTARRHGAVDAAAVAVYDSSVAS